MELDLKVTKPHLFIETSNAVASKQKKAFSALIYNALKTIKDQEKFSMPVSEISHLIGTSNDQRLKNALEDLCGTAVSWNVFDSKGLPKGWRAASLVSDVWIKDGICTYKFSEGVRELIIGGYKYASLDFAVMRHIMGKHALALWEYCSEFIGSQSGSTGWRTVKQWHNFFGLKDGEYPTFFEFNRSVIRKAIDEINKVSDIRIKAEYKRKNRVVSELRFFVDRASDSEKKQINVKPKKIKIPEFEKWFQDQPKNWKNVFDADFENSCDVVDEPTRAEIYREAKRRAHAKATHQEDNFLS